MLSEIAEQPDLDFPNENQHNLTSDIDEITVTADAVLGIDLKRSTHEIICEGALPPIKIENSVIEHVNDIVGKTFGKQRIFDTKAHREIYSVLIGHLKNLHAGKYVDTQGVCCSTLVGAKGIGKTACFKSFAKLAKYIRPVIVLYVSFNNVRSDGSRLGNHSLAQIIVEELKDLNIHIEKNNRKLTTCELIVDSLVKENMYLLLLIDEFDQLYKLDGKENPKAVATVNDLAYFGNQPSGHVSVLLCGSSALMENLVTTNSNEQIRAEFPLLSSGAINLNGTKYRTKRVYSTLPNDLHALQSIMGLEKFEENTHNFRLVAYVTGCSARNVQRLLNDPDDQSTIIGSSSPENSLTGANTLANKNIAALRNAILNELVKKNTKLLVQIFGTSNCTDADIVRNIATLSWENDLLPLTYSEVENVWTRLEKAKIVESSDRGDLVYYILHLTDRCWLTISGIRDSRPEMIYPFSLSSLGAEIMTSSNKIHVLERIIQTVRDFGQNVNKVASSPQFLGRVAPVVISTVFLTTGCSLGCTLS